MNKAILVIDIQNDYCSPKGIMAKAGKSLNWINNTVEKIQEFLLKSEKIPVFFIKTVSSDLSDFEKEKQENWEY